MDTSPTTLVPREVLEHRLVRSVDLPCCSTEEPQECRDHDRNWARLMTLKYQECSRDFVDAVVCDFNTPVCVLINDHGEWVMGNGHHRMAIAITYDLPVIPVVFAFDGDWMHEENTEDPGRPVSYGRSGFTVDDDDDFRSANDAIEDEIYARQFLAMA